MKLNLGSSPSWRKDGWTTLDHRALHPFSLPSEAWDMPYANETFEIVFSSHMIEHISHFHIERTIAEINRVMKRGGILRLLTPDLEKLCRAYVERDKKTLTELIEENGSGIRDTLGPGQALLGFLYSPGVDNYLLNSSRSRIIGSYAHIFCYDFEMLSGLLRHYGFSDIRRMSIDESEIADHKELRECPYDADRGISLVVECRKERYVPFDLSNLLLYSGPYRREEIMLARSPKLWLTNVALRTSAYASNFVWWAARTLKRAIVGAPKSTFSKGHTSS